MRRWKVMAAALVVAALLPTQAKELGELIPAAVLRVRIMGSEIVVETDTGEEGSGETLDAAMNAMEHQASGYILYDTIENLILEKRCEYLLPQLQGFLRPSAHVLITNEEINMDGIWEYLKIHKPIRKLSEVNKNGESE